VDVVPTAVRRTSVFRIATAPTRPQRSPNPSNASLPSWNLGTAWCYTGMNYIGAAGLWKGFVPQVRTPGTPSEIRAWGRTALSAWADVVLDRPGRVVFNQTWSPGWRASVGRLHEVARQPVVDLPAGRRRVEISYHPKTLWPALGLTLAGLAACAIVWRLRTRAALARLGRIHLFSPIAIATTAIGLVYLVALR